MLSIQTNLTSLIVQKNLTDATKGLNRAIEQLTTGYKLNHAKDNPANYAMARQMEVKLSSWEVAGENISIGNNMLETAESIAELIGNHLIRIRDLCEQACNGTYGEASIKAIKTEIQGRVSEIFRIRNSAEFNGIKFFGEYDAENNLTEKNINIQVGIDSSSNSVIQINTSLSLNGLFEYDDWDITNSETLKKVDNLLDEVYSYQTRIGASQKRLEGALELAEVNTRNLTSSLSTIKDADIAKVSSDFIKYQILQQACATLLAAANQMPATAIQLL